MFSDEEDLKPLSCFCMGLCPNGIDHGTCETKPGGICFTALDIETDDDGKEFKVLSYGCLPPGEMALIQCQSSHIASKQQKSIECCDEYDHCNKHLFPTIQKPIEVREAVHFQGIVVTSLLASISVCLIVCIVGLILVYLTFKKNSLKKGNDPEVPTFEMTNEKNESSEIEEAHKEIMPIPENRETSDLGSSVSYSEMVQTTIAKQISFEVLIATGKYTQVWRAHWRNQKVAVKIYGEGHNFMWEREKKILQSPLMRHDHIIGHIASDIYVSGIRKNYLIICEYHQHGTLRDYLKNNTFTPEEMIRVVRGLASALNHIHTEIICSSFKPCLTHNNINSTNILVKDNKECCFTGFSKCIRSLTTTNIIDFPKNIKNSDIRYLAPEFLRREYNSKLVETYKMADVYSFSLLLWEIANRCEKQPTITNTQYQLPFEVESNAENLDCTWKNLTELVANKKIRPQFRPEWNEDAILKPLRKIIEEGWSSNPSVRLTSLRIKKSIFKIENEHVGQIV